MTKITSTWPEVDFEQGEGMLQASTLAPDGTPLAARADLEHVEAEQARGMLVEYLRRAIVVRRLVAAPLGEDVTPEVTAYGGGRARYAIGVDFQAQPVGVVLRVLDQGPFGPSPLYHVVAELRGLNEYRFLEAAEEQGCTPANTLCVGDAIGQWQSLDRSRELTSFERFRFSGWTIVAADPFSRRPANPKWSDCAHLGDELVASRQVAFDPTLCPEVAKALGGDGFRTRTPGPLLMALGRALRWLHVRYCALRFGGPAAVPPPSIPPTSPQRTVRDQ